MTENEIKIILSELVQEREAISNRDKILCDKIGQCHYQLDKIKSERIVPPFLDPLIGKLIIINKSLISGWNEDNIEFTVVKLLSWSINDKSPSIIDIHYTNGITYKKFNFYNEGISFLNETDSYSISANYCNNEYIELYDGSEIQKTYGNKIDHYFQ